MTGRRRRLAAVVAATAGGLVLLGLGTGRGFFFLADAESRPVPLEDLDQQLGRLRQLREARNRPGAELPLPDWVIGVVQVLLLLVVVAAVLAAVYALVRGIRALHLLARGRPLDRVETAAYDDDSTGDDAPTAFRRRLRRGLAEGYADLDAAPTAAEAVIGCWLRLLAAAGEAGTEPVPAETPEELVVRVLGAHDVPAGSLRRLAELYEQARFSPHPVDESMRADARRCLDEVSAGLAGVPA